MSKLGSVLCLLIAATAAAVSPAAADPQKPGPLVRTIRFDPHAKAARLAAGELSKLGRPGWTALRQLVVDYERSDLAAARSLASVLASGGEAGRQDLVASLFRGVKDPVIRSIGAQALADAYPRHADIVHEHLLAGGPRGREILRVITTRGMTDEVATTLLASPSVGYEVYEHLRRRDLLPEVPELLPLARNLAPRGLSPRACMAFAKQFASSSNFQLLRALADILRSKDEAVRRGAHALLLTISGKRLRASADIWRSWIDGRTFYEPPPPVSEGAVEAAVLRAAHYLTQDLADDGKALWQRGQSEVGSTALAVLALRAAGVPAKHPAIEEAIRTTLLAFGKGDRPGVPEVGSKREVYNLSLLAMALAAVDGKRYTAPLLAIRDRLVQGQASNGQWTYAAARGTGNLPPLKGDNSNTQYAILALRAIRSAGVPIPRETWEQAAAYWRDNAHEHGGWHYTDAASMRWKRRVSMTSAGVGSLAICLEGLHGDGAAEAIERDPVITRALGYLGTRLLLDGLTRWELYAYYGVERAGMLTGVAAFKSKYRALDWYAAGAQHLLQSQSDEGTWGDPKAKSDVRGTGYGLVIDTAYGILFLQKATATISKKPARTVTVDIKDEKPPTPPKDAPAAKPTPVAPTPTPARALIELDAIEVYTNTETATVCGRITDKGVTVTVGGSPTTVDEQGRFRAAVPVPRTLEVPVVALREGKEQERYRVRAVRDVHPPEIQLIGGAIRSVGKQTIRFRANEPLKGVRSGNLLVPADNNIVDLPVDLPTGRPSIVVTAVDRAGNETKTRFTFKVTNRVLVLDGKSGVRVDLKERPSIFTVECWVRSEGDPRRDQGLVSNTEGSGFGLFWRSRTSPFPTGYVSMGGRKYLVCKAPKQPRLKRWHHLALTYDGKQARLFVNGKLRDELPGETHVSSSRALYIGGEPNSRSRLDSPFAGMIDEVRISRVVRYTQNFKPAKYYGKDAHTILLMHFDTDSETAFFDDSAIGHAGRPAGTPKIEEHKR